MRFLFVNRFYGGQDVPTGRMLADVVTRLAQNGHEVTVLATRADYTAGHTLDVDTGTQHVRVRKLPLTGGGRAKSWIMFWIQALFVIAFSRWDRCILMTDPPFLTLAAPFAKLLRSNCRIDWWTMDLYPEALAAGEILSPGGRIYRILHGLHAASLRSIDGIIALGPCQVARLQAYPACQGKAAATVIVPPWDDRALAPVDAAYNKVLERMDWQGRKVALYAGNLGFGHTFSTVVSAARLLHHSGDDRWVFAFFCRGAQKAALQEAAADLPNVVVADYVPPDETSALLHAATVHVITMANAWEGIVVPSKLYGVLATPAPVLFIGPPEADTAVEIDTYGVGQSLPNGAPAQTVIEALEVLSVQDRPALEDADRGPEAVARFLVKNLHDPQQT